LPDVPTRLEEFDYGNGKEERFNTRRKHTSMRRRRVYREEESSRTQ
jgi:hypothetical protein